MKKTSSVKSEIPLHHIRANNISEFLGFLGYFWLEFRIKKLKLSIITRNKNVFKGNSSGRIIWEYSHLELTSRRTCKLYVVTFKLSSTVFFLPRVFYMNSMRQKAIFLLLFATDIRTDATQYTGEDST